MPVPLELNRLAYHYVDQKLEAPLFSTEEIIVADLQPGIASFLLELVAQIWNAPDAGSTRSARFNLQGEGTDAQACLQAVLHEEEEFFPASRRLAELLHARSPANASPGILAVLRLVHLEGCRPFAALLKLRYQDQELVQLLQSGGPRLDVRRVENVLLDEIQKGALLPHPERE